MDQELLLRNEYLLTENRLLRRQVTGRVCLTDGERKTLAEIGKRLGKRALAEAATIVKPDTILVWHRQLITKKFDGSQHRRSPGRPKIDAELMECPIAVEEREPEIKPRAYIRISGTPFVAA